MTRYHLLLRAAVLASVAAASSVASAEPPRLMVAVDPPADAPDAAAKAAPASAPAPTGLWRALVLGGGPHPGMNQVAIEKNVRYFNALLPPMVERRVLFADGSRGTPSVQYLDGRRMRYRAPILPHIDGPTTRPGLDGALRDLAGAGQGGPLLLYFAGHGSPNRRNLDDNVFDLWGGGGLSVQELAARIEALPEGMPVVMVMAQCFSGSFANVLFEGGRPDGAPSRRDVVGFFAATKERPASGCTPEINEEDYTDFSSFFFAALSGVDRLGRRVTGADYDRNQLVGMNEAYAYALVHQETSDVPVATSDVFLRRFVQKPDRETMATPWSQVLAWAGPAERAVLTGLSGVLGLRGEDRLSVAYELQFGPGRPRPDPEDVTAAMRLRFIRAAKSVVLANALRQSGDKALIERFERLRAAEAKNPLVEARAALAAAQAAPPQAPLPAAPASPPAAPASPQESHNTVSRVEAVAPRPRPITGSRSTW